MTTRRKPKGSGPIYVLATTAGMRQGELLGLRWKDIDLGAGTLTVDRSVYDGEINPPKTEAGNRTIRLSKLAVAALRRHRINDGWSESQCL